MGHRMGQVRDCPGCHHPHAVGTTCWQCPDCRPAAPPAIVAPALTYTLTPDQVAFNTARAEQIQASNDARQQHGRRTYYVPPGMTLLDVAIQGQMAEEAAHQLTGLPRNLRIYGPGEKMPHPKDPDPGRRTEVRSARWHGAGCSVFKSDPDDRLVLLLTGGGITFTARGWIEARQARRDEWKADGLSRVQEWKVPQEALHPLPLPEGA